MSTVGFWSLQINSGSLEIFKPAQAYYLCMHCCACIISRNEPQP